jgi:hypothetical protein
MGRFQPCQWGNFELALKSSSPIQSASFARLAFHFGIPGLVPRTHSSSDLLNMELKTDNRAWNTAPQVC